MSIIKVAALNLKNIKQTLMKDNKDLTDFLQFRSLNRGMSNTLNRMESAQKVNQTLGSLKSKVNALVPAK